MQIPNISLAYLVAELSPLLEGSIVRKVQELENNWLKLKLQTKQGTKDLIVAPNAFFVTSYSLPAKQQTSGFGAFLRKKISNKKILSIKQKGFDRIVLLEFDDFFLVLELFAKGNVILATKEMQIVSAYRKEQWKDRKISKAEQYRFPSSKGASPLIVTLTQLKKTFSESSVDCIRTLVSALNIAPVVGEQACLDAGIEKNKDAKKVKEVELKNVLRALQNLYKVDLSRLRPVLAESGVLLPFGMEAAGKKEKESESICTAIDEHFSSSFAEQKKSVGKSVKGSKLEKSLEKQIASITALEEKIAQSKSKGEAIYTHYLQVSAALQLAKEFATSKIDKKDIMYKLKDLGLEFKQIDLKNKKIVVELEP